MVALCRELPSTQILGSILGRGLRSRYFFSPNSACTMGFWRFQGLVILCRPRAVPGHAKSLKNLQFLSFFKKNGAGARVLRSTFSFFDECFI